jgi:hypothetical protein
MTCLSTITAKWPQVRHYEAARKLGCDEDPAHFDEILKKVARHKSPSCLPATKLQKKIKSGA